MSSSCLHVRLSFCMDVLLLWYPVPLSLYSCEVFLGAPLYVLLCVRPSGSGSSSGSVLIYDHTRRDFRGGLKFCMYIQKCLTRWKMVKINVGVPPPQIKNNLGAVQIFFVKNEKNQSCSKLPEMARKLVENDFRTF